MITKIGIAAGEIWNALESSQDQTIEMLADHLKRDSELILMAIGWLCREGYCTAIMSEGSIVVSLRRN